MASFGNQTYDNRNFGTSTVMMNGVGTSTVCETGQNTDNELANHATQTSSSQSTQTKGAGNGHIPSVSASTSTQAANFSLVPTQAEIKAAEAMGVIPPPYTGGATGSSATYDTPRRQPANLGKTDGVFDDNIYDDVAGGGAAPLPKKTKI